MPASPFTARPYAAGRPTGKPSRRGARHLTTSAPRRMPPSTNTSSSSPAAATTSASAGGRRLRVELASTVVRHYDGVDADLGGTACVFRGHHALDDDLPGPLLAQLLHVRPGRRAVLIRAHEAVHLVEPHTTPVDAIVAVREFRSGRQTCQPGQPGRFPGDVGDVPKRRSRWHRQSVVEIAFAFAGHRDVPCNDEHLDPARSRAIDVITCDAGVGPERELAPRRTRSFTDHILDRPAGPRAVHEDRAAARGSPRQRKVTMGMEQPSKPIGAIINGMPIRRSRTSVANSQLLTSCSTRWRNAVARGLTRSHAASIRPGLRRREIEDHPRKAPLRRAPHVTHADNLFSQDTRLLIADSSLH